MKVLNEHNDLSLLTIVLETAISRGHSMNVSKKSFDNLHFLFFLTLSDDVQ